jgi:hypothetical protein
MTKYTIEVDHVTDENLFMGYEVEAETAAEARAKVMARLPVGDWYISDIYAFDEESFSRIFRS